MAKWIICALPGGGVSASYARNGSSTDLGTLTPDELPRGAASILEAVWERSPLPGDLIFLPGGLVLSVLPFHGQA